MAESLDILSLRLGQLAQVLDQFRVETYNQQLKMTLLIKILEEKKILSQGEFDKRWPLYLKNDVGVIGPDGMMEGSLNINFYGMEGAK